MSYEACISSSVFRAVKCCTQVLAKKMIAIMELSQQQLSKQDHYDYGLRSFVIPIARAAGKHFCCADAQLLHPHLPSLFT